MPALIPERHLGHEENVSKDGRASGWVEAWDSHCTSHHGELGSAGYIYFGPMAPSGEEQTWVQTIPGQGWWVYLRFYAPTQAHFEQSWAMPDFEKVK